jgi:short-subunit dehydrogenase
MKLKQILLNVLAVVMTFEYVGSNILAIMYPSWAGLVIGVMSAIAFIMVFNKAHFYKYK